MDTPSPPARDVLLVCRNGHVITDLLTTHPEHGPTHCDRCGAPTLDRCPTCGQPIPGAVPVPGLTLAGRRRPPDCCAVCGASFPWATRTAEPAPEAPASLDVLERLLRRLPRTVRQFRSRHGDRHAFRVEDVYDLEDLLRAVLPLQFDDVRTLSRTPSYSPLTRTDFLLQPEGVALTVKRLGRDLREPAIAAHLEEDAAYHGRHRTCETLVAFLYDPECLLREPARLETVWSRLGDGLTVRCVVAS
jgi:hypothetical protein